MNCLFLLQKRWHLKSSKKNGILQEKILVKKKNTGLASVSWNHNNHPRRDRSHGLKSRLQPLLRNKRVAEDDTSDPHDFNGSDQGCPHTRFCLKIQKWQIDPKQCNFWREDEKKSTVSICFKRGRYFAWHCKRVYFAPSPYGTMGHTLS